MDQCFDINKYIIFIEILLFRFKDETKGECIIQFCGLHAKCYSLVTKTEQKLAAAGVKKSKQHLLKHHKYVEILSEFSRMNIKQKTISSQAHELYTQEQERIGLSALDIKRVLLPDGINTVPYGYFGDTES